jgi:hypothetical protein
MELDRLRPGDNATPRTYFWVIIDIAILQTGIRYPIFNPGFDICVHLRSKPLLMVSLPSGEACLAQVMSHFCVPQKTRHRDKTRQNTTNRDIFSPTIGYRLLIRVYRCPSVVKTCFNSKPRHAVGAVYDRRPINQSMAFKASLKFRLFYLRPSESICGYNHLEWWHLHFEG